MQLEVNCDQFRNSIIAHLFCFVGSKMKKILVPVKGKKNGASVKHTN